MRFLQASASLLFGFVMLGEPLTTLKILSALATIVGVTGLKIAGT